MSMNKLFDYLASGRPILANSVPAYDLIKRYECGISTDIQSPERYADIIKEFADLPGKDYSKFCTNARQAVEKFDFRVLTEKIESVFAAEKQ